MIRRFDRRFEKKNLFLRIDRRFDDSIDDLKEKKYFFMIRRFDDSISIRRLKDRLSIGQNIYIISSYFIFIEPF